MNLNAIDYKIAMKLTAADLPFTALLAAAMARADSTTNFKTLRDAFPNVADDLQARYDAVGGILPRELENTTQDVPELSIRADSIAKNYLEKIHFTAKEVVDDRDQDRTDP